jgi:hypothetical protein
MLILTRKFFSLSSRVKLFFASRYRFFAGRHVISESAANDWIAARLASREPFMVSRLGSVELSALVNAQGVLSQQSGKMLKIWKSCVFNEPLTWQSNVINQMVTNAGFFSADATSLSQYALEVGEYLRNADLMAVWFMRHEDRILKKYAPECLLALPKGIEPYYYERPWSLALANRRVLVIHPFAETIRRQFINRRKLFGQKLVLPDFDLLTLPAVQTIAGQTSGFLDWFTALDSMRQRIKALDFDVAIIGAGAYGLPLSAFVKRMGRQAIHMGGATQILFGIRGRRWDKRPEVAGFYNDYWVRPMAEETPMDAEKVEEGCYW